MIPSLTTPLLDHPAVRRRLDEQCALGEDTADDVQGAVAVTAREPVQDARAVQVLSLRLVGLDAFEHRAVLVRQVPEPVKVLRPQLRGVVDRELENGLTGWRVLAAEQHGCLAEAVMQLSSAARSS